MGGGGEKVGIGIPRYGSERQLGMGGGNEKSRKGSWGSAARKDEGGAGILEMGAGARLRMCLVIGACGLNLEERGRLLG
jgi:hypothetical protein